MPGTGTEGDGLPPEATGRQDVAQQGTPVDRPRDRGGGGRGPGAGRGERMEGAATEDRETERAGTRTGRKTSSRRGQRLAHEWLHAGKFGPTATFLNAENIHACRQ